LHGHVNLLLVLLAVNQLLVHLEKPLVV
jgi:hypothetical protein